MRIYQTPPDQDPINTDTGQPYKLAMIGPDGRAVYADTWHQLAEPLIDGYNQTDIIEQLTQDGTINETTPPETRQRHIRDERTKLRIRYAVKTQVWIQSWLTADHDPQFRELPADRQALLMGSRTTQPNITEWDSDLPLVLSRHEYEPYGPKRTPTGNIVWINPHRTDTLLMSLHLAQHLTVVLRHDVPQVVYDPFLPEGFQLPRMAPPETVPSGEPT